MASLPKPQSAPVDARTGYFAREWYDFLRALSSGDVDLDALRAEFTEQLAGKQDVSQLLTRLERLVGTGYLFRNSNGLYAVRFPTAEEVTYDNTVSGLTAADVQAAIDELAATPSSGGVPYFVPDGQTYTVPVNTQALFTMPITLGTGSSLVVDGYLVEVS